MTSRAVLSAPERKALRLTALCLVLAGGAGLFFGYANPVYQFPPLVLLFPACLATLGRIMPSRKEAFYAAWLCATLGHATCLYWLSVPMHDYGMMPWALTAPLIIGLGAFLGLYNAVFALVWRMFRQHFSCITALLLVWALWTSLDLVRGWLFSGFPWISLSTAFIAWPQWAQGAALIGSHALSGFFALAATALAEAWPVRVPDAAGPGITPVRRRRLCALMAALCLLVPYGYGVMALRAPLPAGEAFSVGLVQGNIDQNQKWAPAYQQGTLTRYLTLSEWAVNPAMGRVAKPVDLIIWPETAMPFYLETNPALAERIATFAQTFATPVLFGAPGKGVAGEQGYHNRMWLQTPEGGTPRYYDKIRLVPFGEYMPLNIPLPFLSEFLQVGSFAPGSDVTPLRSGNLALGGLICYEAIFPELARERVAAGANVLVTISNDAWFGRTAAPVQHLHLAAMRAIEQGRYVLRATNTGISAIISPRGIVTAHSSLFRAEVVTGEARRISALTPFFHAGPFIAGLSFLFAFAAFMYCRGKDLREKRLRRP